MKLLAIETSSTACSVALLSDDKIHLLHRIAPMQQAQMILGMIQEILTAQQTHLNDMQALAFGCGPGSFTGIRIATSVMQGLAFAAELPLIPISSLAALAQTAYQASGWQNLCVAVDARMQEVYWGVYEVKQNGLVELADNEIICAPQLVIAPAGAKEGWYGVGNAWEVYASQLPFKPKAIAPACAPTAEAVALLAKEKCQRKEWVSANEALPTYLRDNVVSVRNSTASRAAALDNTGFLTQPGELAVDPSKKN